jgi:peroxiredoxin
MIAAVMWSLIYLIMPFSVHAEGTGSKAPSFRLNDTYGTAVAMEDFAGKVVLLNFWATWCASCREELPEFDRLYAKYRHDGFMVIGISVDSSDDRVATFLRKTPVAFPIVVDRNGDIASAYRFSGLPAGYLIGRDGNIKKQFMGFSNDLLPQYEKDIIELLKHQ